MRIAPGKFVGRFTHIRKRRISLPLPRLFTGRRFALVLTAVVLGLLLAGCTPSTEPIDENTPGWFNHYFIYNFSRLLTLFADWFGGDYGLSVVVVTILIRLALMPLMRRQFLAQRRMQEKMKIVQPKMKEIQEKYQGQNTPEAQKQMQQEMLRLYQEHQFNPLAIGCLPLLLQFPFLIAFYYAILRTPEISMHGFLWFNLGDTDLIMPLVAAGSYFLQIKLAQKMNGPVQANPANPQMTFLMYLSPVMIGAISFASPAVLPLYWAVGAFFLIVQNAVFHRLYPRAS